MLNGAQKFIVKTESDNVKASHGEVLQKVKSNSDANIPVKPTPIVSGLTSDNGKGEQAQIAADAEQSHSSAKLSELAGATSKPSDSAEVKNNQAIQGQQISKDIVEAKQGSEKATFEQNQQQAILSTQQKPNTQATTPLNTQQSVVEQITKQGDAIQQVTMQTNNDELAVSNAQAAGDEQAVNDEMLAKASTEMPQVANKKLVSESEVGSGDKEQKSVTTSEQFLRAAPVGTNDAAPVVKADAATETTQSRTINQSTASVMAAITKEQGTSTATNANHNQAADDEASKNPENVIEEVALAKAANDKNAVVSERSASMVNQTLDAQASRPTLSATELPMQQEQSFENTINKLSGNAVQSQKSITALNTETIAIYRKDFANAVKDKVMVMINQKIQQVEIQLDPPEMGNVHVRVNLQNEQAAVQFIVQNQQAKDALEQNMGKLRDMLAESGVDVGDANIEQRQPGEQSETAFEDGESRGKNGLSSEQAADENLAQTQNVVKASSTGVDYYA